MDPDEVLKLLRAYVVRVNHAFDTEEPDEKELASLAISLAEHFESLDNWLSGKGFIPAEWDR